MIPSTLLLHPRTNWPHNAWPHRGMDLQHQRSAKRGKTRAFLRGMCGENDRTIRHTYIYAHSSHQLCTQDSVSKRKQTKNAPNHTHSEDIIVLFSTLWKPLLPPMPVAQHKKTLQTPLFHAPRKQTKNETITTHYSSLAPPSSSPSLGAGIKSVLVK